MYHSVVRPDQLQVAFGYENYRDLLDAVGTSRFKQALIQTIHRNVHVDEILAYSRTEKNGAINVVASEGTMPGSEARAEAYRTKHCKFDPIIGLLDKQTVGEILATRIACNDICPPEYRRACFSDARLSEKLSFVQRGPSGWVVLSLYRSQDSDQFTDDEFYGASQCAEMLLPILMLHCRQVVLDRRTNPATIPEIEVRLKSAFPCLTGRETSVCARTVAGMTAEGAALDLGIKQSSVLTYRRRAYERLNIVTSQQLSVMLIR